MLLPKLSRWSASLALEAGETSSCCRHQVSRFPYDVPSGTCSQGLRMEEVEEKMEDTGGRPEAGTPQDRYAPGTRHQLDGGKEPLLPGVRHPGFSQVPVQSELSTHWSSALTLVQPQVTSQCLASFTLQTGALLPGLQGMASLPLPLHCRAEGSPVPQTPASVASLT